MKRFIIFLRNVVVIAASLAATTFFASCEKDKLNPDAPAFVEFSFANQRGTSDIDAKKRTVKAVAECGTNLASLTAEFKLSPDGATATVGGKPQTSGTTSLNFGEPVVYTLATPEGATAEWTVTVTLPDDCPAMLKAATIRYGDHEGNTHYLCFDNYGKQRRYEAINNDGEHGIFIHDEINGNYHIWEDEDGWVPDQYVTAATTSGVTAIFFAEAYQHAYNYWTILPGATKTTETIAGQLCDMYRIPAGDVTAVYGVWANTVMLRIVDEINKSGLEATRAKTGCPANAFNKTISINWD